jgi:ADP-ribose pyrophosphatase YjhB (NUDIX family)
MVQSYKIFIRDKPVLIAEGDFLPDGSEYIITEPEFRKNIPASIHWLIDHHFGDKAVILTISAMNLFWDIQKELKKITAAGGLVWNDQDQLLMIYRKGRWDLPKGKLEKDEAVEYAAVREVKEETGLENLKITGKLHETWHIYKENETLILKDTHWFRMRSSDTHELIPQINEGILQAEWVNRKEIPLKMTNTYASLKDLFEKIEK